jgi:hypothetical protein
MRKRVLARAAEVEAAVVAGQGEETKERRPLRIDDLSVYSGNAYLNHYPPNYRYLIDKSMRLKCLASIAGPPGAGKGTAGIEFCTSVAGGAPWLDTWQVIEPGRVLYISAEDDQEVIHRRFHHAIKSLPQEKQAEAAANFYGIPVHGCVNLCRGKRGAGVVTTPHLEDLRTLIDRIRPVLVVIDTLSRFCGIDENDNPSMTTFCGHLEDVIADFGCNIILLHHTNKAAGDCVDDPKELAKSLSQTALRGAGGFVGCTRWVMLMAPMGAKLAMQIIGEKAQGKADGSFVACRVAKKNVGAPEPRHYLGRDNQGLLYRVEAQGQAYDHNAINDAHQLADEILRRERTGESRLSASRCGIDAFKWGMARTKKAVETGLDLDLFSKVKMGRGEQLFSVCINCSDTPDTKEFSNDNA